MSTRLRTVLSVAFASALAACSKGDVLSPNAVPSPAVDLSAAALPPVRIAEFHYDNSGADAGEAIEISGPAGTDLTGWQIVLYNGSGGAPYGTTTLSGTLPTSCGARGVFVQNYPSNGIQNGSPDGIALVNASGVLIEFLSYEGVFAGVGGAANGVTSTDIGTSEAGTEPLGQSLQRTGLGTWSAPAASTFGTCNDDAALPPPPVASVTVTPTVLSLTIGATAPLSAAAFDGTNQPIAGTTFAWASSNAAVATVSVTGVVTGVTNGTAQVTATSGGVSASATVSVTAAPSLPSIRFSEIHYDNFGTDAGESIEVEGPAGSDLTGWQVVLYNGSNGAPYGTTTLATTISATCTPRGVVVVSYPQDGLQNGSPDGFALVNASGTVVEFLSYEGSMTGVGGPANGLVSTDIGVAESSSPLGQSLQRDAQGTWAAPAASSFGSCNGGPPTPPANSITFSGRTASDPALPVGFQDQLFATMRSGTGVVIPTTFTWTTENTSASVDTDGVVTALAAGTAQLRATASDGTTATYTLATQVATSSPSAIYAGNAEFGEPADGTPADDIIIRRTEFTSSYNPARGTPNWVAYNLEATHFGAQDRCDCFTFDPLVPAGAPQYTTAAYTGAGAFHGYGIDRGHLARSFDRTSGSLDNARSFYFTNIIPQAADQNQGPWAVMENFLGDQARVNNKEVYIIAGVAGSKGTLKDQGTIVIPAATWKVALILPRDRGLGSVLTPSDADVIAAIMPNDPGVRNVDWNTYRTTVDAVEALSGYDLLALLNDQVEIALESNTRAPVAAINGPFVSSEGGPLLMSGAGSSDPDNDVLTYHWSFGDGTTATGVAPVHTYVQDGSYAVTLTVTDTRGLIGTTTTTAAVSNVAPAIATFAGATLLPGETYTATGAFTDPGADTWTASVSFGAGAGVKPLSLSGQTFALSNVYDAAGTFTVTVTVSDDDATSTAATQVVVLSGMQTIQRAIAIVDTLEMDGKLNHGLANSLQVQLRSVDRRLDDQNGTPATQLLANVISRVEQMVQVGHLTANDAQPLITLLQRLLVSIGG